MNTFATLADPTRLQIFELIAQGEKSVGQIVQQFPYKPPTISQHLRMLREARLVRVRTEGQRRYYAVNSEGLYEIDQWLNEMKRHWEMRLDILEDVLIKESGER